MLATKTLFISQRVCDTDIRVTIMCASEKKAVLDNLSIFNNELLLLYEI